MDALQLMIKDHREVDKILEELTQTSDRAVKQREKLFMELKLSMDAHAEMEEKVFYPRLKEKAESKQLALEAYEEHALVKDLLKQLEKMAKDDERFLAKMTVLKENIQHHVKEEEQELFKFAQDLLGKDELEDLGTKMQEIKEKFLEKAKK